MDIAIRTAATMSFSEIERLRAASHLIEGESGTIISVETVFWDHGMNWKWTTLIAQEGHRRFDRYQLLTPKEQELILTGSLDQFMDVVKQKVKMLTERKRK